MPHFNDEKKRVAQRRVADKLLDELQVLVLNESTEQQVSGKEMRAPVRHENTYKSRVQQSRIADRLLDDLQVLMLNESTQQQQQQQQQPQYSEEIVENVTISNLSEPNHRISMCTFKNGLERCTT